MRYNSFILLIRFLALPFMLVFLNLSGICQEQKAMGQQLSFTCDNNFLLFNGDDGYYTNGVFLRYDRISRKSGSTSPKKVFSYEVGQMIYTAHTRKILPKANAVFPGGIEQIDRPIAGYLFGKASCSSFFSDHRMLAFGASVGTIGEHSLGRSVQEYWHRMIHVKDYWNWVWDYQVRNELGINIHGTFANSLFKNETQAIFQITPVTQATLGTTFTNISQAILLQVGRMRPMSSSSYWHSRLQLARPAIDSRVELFFYYRPEVKYQLYNATIQGGFFRDDKGKITSEIKPLVMSHEIGLTFSVPRYSIAYQVAFQSKEAKTQFYNQTFASVIATFRFE